jgi:UDP-2,3-diacylglucosamine pyrophosphatase LpxH
MEKELDTVIISDLHLGSPISLAKDLLQCLKSLKFKRLILNGDIFADLNFSRLKKDHWAVLSYLREISNPKHGIEIVWISGNHDPELSLLMGHLVGIKVLDKYEWIAYNKTYVVMHGHQFDPAMIGIPGISKVIGWWYLQIQKIPGLKIRFSRWLDLITAHFQNLSSVVETRAIRYARSHGIDVIICGHTHKAMSTEKSGVRYYNSGCWVKTEGTYIQIQGEDIRVKQYCSN